MNWIALILIIVNYYFQSFQFSSFWLLGGLCIFQFISLIFLLNIRTREKALYNWNSLNNFSDVEPYVKKLEKQGDQTALAVQVRLSKPTSCQNFPFYEGQQEIADRLSRLTRRCDLVSHRNDQDFILILNIDDGNDNADKLASRLLKGLTEDFSWGQCNIPFQVNMGVTAFKPGDGFAILIDQISKALDCSLEAGPNSYHILGLEANGKINRETRIKIYLRRALENDEMDVHFQPKISVRTGNIDSVEALVRWSNPHLGQVSPNEFIPIAERSNAIGFVSRFVINKSFDMLSRMKSEGYKALRLSINISPNEILDKTILTSLMEALDCYEVDPQAIDLEITEGAFLKDNRAARNIMKDIKELGFNISIDDFGTGYSSLGYLNTFYFDSLKIDKSFIDRIQNDNNSLAIVKTIIELSQSLNLKTVAEGVENLEQVEILKALGCDLLQGFYFSEPLCYEDLADYMIGAQVYTLDR